jgi:peptidase C39-like protein
MPPVPVYVPKRRPDDAEPWVAFGSGQLEYQRWIPEVCGICCLKMIGDTIGVTNNLTLYQLTMMAVANGTFMVGEHGTIQGAFHYPLAELAERLGIRCRVMRTLSASDITKALAQGMYAILSIDAARVDSSQRGGHLVLVYGDDRPADSFSLHDCSSMMRPDGCGVSISTSALASISNNKGLVAGWATGHQPARFIPGAYGSRVPEEHNPGVLLSQTSWRSLRQRKSWPFRKARC